MTNILGQLDKVVKNEKKKKAQPKQKGKVGETYFAEKLSEISGHHFHRIYSSGASVGKSNNILLEELTNGQAQAHIGDIHSPEDFTHYFIWESKNYADLDFHNLLNPKFSKQVSGWIDELEYDLQSAFTLLKDNYRTIAGFLCIKITRKGSWIVGNKKYIQEIFFKDEEMKCESILYFNKDCNEVLKEFGFGNEYFMTDFETFIKLNKDKLFVVDEDRLERIKKAKEILGKMIRK